MSETINAEIVAIGTEILLGEITDTNSVYIAKLLRDIGMNLFYMTSVGDNEGRIADVLRTALSRANVVITCGGLGPTVDDMTRQAVASATNRGLTFHQNLLDSIAERFASFRAQMTDNNRRQAYLPDEAILIENPVGTAPAFMVEHEGRVIISLPGVPREMKFLMVESVIPYLRERFNLGSGIIKARVLRTAGIGESLLDSIIGTELLEQHNPTVGLAAHTGQVDVRITAKASDESEADRMIEVVEAQLRERIGKYIFGTDEQRIESVLIGLMLEAGEKAAIVEAGIGEPVSRGLRAVEQGDKVVSASFQYESPDALRTALSLPADMLIRQVSEQAAEHFARMSNAGIGISVVSHPDMGDDHADSEGSTAISVFVDGQMRSRVYGFGAMAEVAPVWAASWTMAMAWQMLREKVDAQ